MFHPMMSGGDKGTRTPDLCVANASLYQLSHIPKISKSILADFPEKSYHFKGPFKKNFRRRSDSSSKDFLPSSKDGPSPLLPGASPKAIPLPHRLAGSLSPSSVAPPAGAVPPLITLAATVLPPLSLSRSLI